MSNAVRNVLFVCTGNSGRSIMAEAILNRLGASFFRAFSAGSRPKGVVHPEALRLLTRLNYDTHALRSKSWNEFAAAPVFDHIVTVCSNAAGETCPVIAGKPSKIHWDIPDPASAQGTQSEIEAAFRAVYDILLERIEAFARVEAGS